MPSDSINTVLRTSSVTIWHQWLSSEHTLLSIIPTPRYQRSGVSVEY